MRAVVISLPERADRLAEFDRDALPWPVAIHEGYNGRCQQHIEWTASAGAYGCMMAHTELLAEAVLSQEPTAIFEDDAVFVPDFRRRVGQLLAELPDDWELVMLGGQHIRPPLPVRPGLVRCLNTHRTHAYLVRGRAPYVLLRAALFSHTHVDVAYASVMQQINAYAPDPFLVGQRAGHSDVTDHEEPERFWSTP